MQLSWVSGARGMTLRSPMLTSGNDLKVQTEKIRACCPLTEVLWLCITYRLLMRWF